MALKTIHLKKGEDRRIRGGHPWVFSNEIATTLSPLKSFEPGQEILLESHDKTKLGVGYVNPHSLIAVRLFSRDLNDRLDNHFIENRLKKALLLRERLFAKPYYRLVFSEADELPGLIIDRYGEDLVLQINTAGMDVRQTVIQESLLAILPKTRSILLRNDSQIRQYEQLDTYVKAIFGTPPDEVALEENGVRFLAPLWKGQKTGWFYDQRMNRARLKEYVKDKVVLDVFSYLGGFGIQAASFGAKAVTCVDASAYSCDFIKKNAALNGLAGKVSLFNQDAFLAMKELAQHKKYDVIVLDPPAFVKKAKDRKEGLIAYQRLNELALKMLHPEGILFSCSCSMHISMEDLTEIVRRSALRSQSKVQILERGHQAMDHPIHFAIPETDYLKTLVVRKI